MSGPKKHEWYALLTLDYGQKTFVMERILLAADYSSAPRPHICVSSSDEIGAYMEAKRVLTALGFEPRADTA